VRGGLRAAPPMWTIAQLGVPSAAHSSAVGNCRHGLHLVHLLPNLSDLVAARDRYLGHVEERAALHTDLHVPCGPLLFGQEEQQAEEAEQGEDYGEDDCPGRNLGFDTGHVASDPLGARECRGSVRRDNGIPRHPDVSDRQHDLFLPGRSRNDVAGSAYRLGRCRRRRGRRRRRVRLVSLCAVVSRLRSVLIVHPSPHDDPRVRSYRSGRPEPRGLICKLLAIPSARYGTPTRMLRTASLNAWVKPGTARFPDRRQ
jgi:hypothetical protein